MGVSPKRLTAPAFLVILFLSAASSVTATPITTYFITVNTSSIDGLTGQLDFQFNPGSGALGAFVDISQFGFSDGGFNGSPTLTGGASGSLGSTVHIDNSTGFNDFLQPWIFGLSLQFQVSFGGAAITSPDGSSTDTFGLALYDLSFNPQLNDGSEGDFIVTIDVNTDGSTTANPAAKPANSLTVTPVLTPEPATWMLFGLAGIVLWRKWHRL